MATFNPTLQDKVYIALLQSLRSTNREIHIWVQYRIKFSSEIMKHILKFMYHYKKMLRSTFNKQKFAETQSVEEMFSAEIMKRAEMMKHIGLL